MQDDRTKNLNLPLPHGDNTLDEDQPRLRAALVGLDAATGKLADDLVGLDAARQGADADLASDLAAETAARKNADAALADDLTTEATARQEAVNVALSAAAAAASKANTAQSTAEEALEKSGSGIPLLSIIWSASSIEPGFLDISQNNGLLLRSAFPDAWAKISTLPASLLLTDTAWLNESGTNGGVCGKFSAGDGSTTFRVPLIGKRFIRATGSGLDAGTAQGDAIRNIKGTLSRVADQYPVGQTTGSFQQTTITSANLNGGPTGAVSAFAVNFDASRVVPTDAENRPVAVAYTPLLKMYGAAIDSGTLDLAALAQSLTGKLDASASFGVGQSWQTMTASRALATTYTNTTGRPVMVNIAATSSAAAAVLRLTIDAIVVSGSGGPAANNPMSVTAIAPNGSTYAATVSAGTGTLTSWSELR